jgi:hypothetical protein
MSLPSYNNATMDIKLSQRGVVAVNNILKFIESHSSGRFPGGRFYGGGDTDALAR